MSSSPRVSIVINNFNYARFLAQSIDSALGQTHPGTEVVVVDDVSTDGSREVIRSYADRIVPVLRERNGGQGAAVNAGFRASHGEIVFFLDADDYLHPHAVSRVVAAWSEGISKAQFRLDLVDASGEKIDLYPSPEVQFDSGDVVPRLLATGRYQTTVMSGNAFARSALERVLPVPEEDFRISADGYLVTLTPFYGPVLSLEEPLGAYRLHGANAWSVGRSAPSPAELASRLRKVLHHDQVKYRALEALAQKLALRTTASPGMRDPQHLAARLGSLCLDPAQHLPRGDWRAVLALRGALASRTAPLPFRRRATLAAWFLAVGLLPRKAARHAAAWYFAPGSRPAAVDRVFKTARRLLRPTGPGPGSHDG
jgi:hypothetical protein